MFYSSICWWGVDMSRSHEKSAARGIRISPQMFRGWFTFWSCAHHCLTFQTFFKLLKLNGWMQKHLRDFEGVEAPEAEAPEAVKKEASQFSVVKTVINQPWLGMVQKAQLFLVMHGGWCKWHCFNHKKTRDSKPPEASLGGSGFLWPQARLGQGFSQQNQGGLVNVPFLEDCEDH